MKGTPVRQVVRRPEPELEPGKVLNNVEDKVIEGAVKKKLAMLVDEVRLILVSESVLGRCL